MFAGYVVQGSNGEYPYMRSDERVQLVEAVKKMAAPDKLIIAGSGCECRRNAGLARVVQSALDPSV